MPADTSYSTLHEMEFLSEIKSEAVLERYLLTAEKRANWGAIDKRRVIDHAEMLLLRMRRMK